MAHPTKLSALLMGMGQALIDNNQDRDLTNEETQSLQAEINEISDSDNTGETFFGKLAGWSDLLYPSVGIGWRGIINWIKGWDW